MTLFFPDLNVWLALSDDGHPHNLVAWAWLNELAGDSTLIFSRYTQIGLLRLLTNRAVMNSKSLTLNGAWAVYNGWIQDPRVEFYPEPRNVDARFLEATKPFAAKAASKWVGDCWLLAYAVAAQARLVTFDRALAEFALKQGHRAMIPE